MRYIVFTKPTPALTAEFDIPDEIIYFCKPDEKFSVEEVNDIMALVHICPVKLTACTCREEQLIILGSILSRNEPCTIFDATLPIPSVFSELVRFAKTAKAPAKKSAAKKKKEAPVVKAPEKKQEKAKDEPAEEEPEPAQTSTDVPEDFMNVPETPAVPEDAETPAPPKKARKKHVESAPAPAPEPEPAVVPVTEPEADPEPEAEPVQVVDVPDDLFEDDEPAPAVTPSLNKEKLVEGQPEFSDDLHKKLYDMIQVTAPDIKFHWGTDMLMMMILKQAEEAEDEEELRERIAAICRGNNKKLTDACEPHLGTILQMGKNA